MRLKPINVKYWREGHTKDQQSSWDPPHREKKRRGQGEDMEALQFLLKFLENDLPESAPSWSEGGGVI